MYTIFYETSFKATHQLTYHHGQQEDLHEHEWKFCAAISSEQLNKDELVMDFNDLKSLMDNILQDFHAGPLETMGFFKHRNASAESVAQVLYELLAPRLPTTVRLEFTEITEAAGCRARYSVKA